MKSFQPEGQLINTAENRKALLTHAGIREAFCTGTVLESRALLCDNEHNLHVELGTMRGIIPRLEGAIGIDDGSVRDIALISRVNKPVVFKVTGFKTDDSGETVALLSRKSVQLQCVEEYLSHLIPGDIINARVTHMENFGAFVDVGAGISALLPIDSISVSRIPHPNVRFFQGQSIRAVVKNIDEQGRITLTHKELIGTWEQNAAAFSPGETVPGIVRSVEKYGIFVELAPNLAGLAEYSDGVVEGNHACVYIKSVIPERMKIKLIIVDSFSAQYPPTPSKYFTDTDHIDRWVYSPESCQKVIETVF
ncbi:MAG TPA: S1 RNA-binding domain-containing protein [Clostridia bacterium]|nr:S1 RNA-binding domain-containing protein [Clostridia bacterium]